jgi:hypothetical protein
MNKTKKTSPVMYSFCESSYAGPRALWHIRELTARGKMLGGGIDTGSLCGHPKVREGWDINVEITAFHLAKNCCPKCAALYAKRVLGATGNEK